jgi:lysophospholipase L1-like esterase
MNRPTFARRPLIVFALAVLLFLLIELAVQARAVIRYGYSLVQLMEQQSNYVVDTATGLKLLRPNGLLVRNKLYIRSNSLGLRGNELIVNRGPHGLRVAVVGASTVMGVSAPDNEHTFPALLEQRLREQMPGTTLEVVNAGIAGYTLDDEQAMLAKRVLPLNPDLIVLYPGNNDFAPYCNPPRWRAPPALQGLPQFGLPEWWMSDDLVLSTTERLRIAPPVVTPDRDPDEMDMSAYRARVASLIETAASHGSIVLVATVARSFRPEQPRELQESLSAEIRASLRCFSVDGLHRLFDRHNVILKSAAVAANVAVLDLDRMIPGGSTYFASTTHFAEAGEIAAADALAEFIRDHRLLDPATRP